MTLKISFWRSFERPLESNFQTTTELEFVFAVKNDKGPTLRISLYSVQKRSA